MRIAGICTAFLVLAFAVDVARGEEKVKEAAKIDYSEIAEAGPGVYKVVTDKAGRIQSCLVVGSSRISTVLGAAKGKEIARQRAALQADAEFIKWLKAEVSVHETRQDEIILFLEGNKENDKEARREAGKATEKNTAQFQSAAKGLVRGMQVKHFEVNAKEKTLTVVKLWKAKTASAVKDIEKDLKEPTRGGEKTPGSDAKKPAEKKSSDKTIKDKKVTIDD
jgi:MinD-like ATPase involved in chromosome partitioning or flagellar assembly